MKNRRTRKTVNIAKRHRQRHAGNRDYYALIFALRGPIRIAYLKLTSVAEFEETAAYYADLWRGHLRKTGQDSVLCRRRIMAHALCQLVQKGMGQAPRYTLALALALAMTDRAQQLVESEDKRQQRTFGDN